MGNFNCEFCVGGNMAFDAQIVFTNTDGTPFPDTEGVNASGPLTIDGTEFVKAMVDNYMFGPQQALLNYAGLTPNGVSEEDGNSQELEAMQKSFGHPGELVGWFGNNDPASLGLRVLLMQGQGILVANYSELVAAAYIGDPDNGTSDSFFRADDAAGTIRNTGGNYMILPDARGLAIRGMDNTGLVDPDGATRLPGDSQLDAFQGHFHDIPTRKNATNSNENTITEGATDGSPGTVVGGAGVASIAGGFSTPRVEDETRMVNLSAHLAVRY